MDNHNNLSNMLELHYWNQNGEVTVHLSRLFSSLDVDNMPVIKKCCIECIGAIDLSSFDIDPTSCFIELTATITEDESGLKFNCIHFTPHELQ